jgi:hypothetical protein
MKDFIPYEQALALKELGFDEPCLGNYADDENHTLFTNGNKPGKTNAPLYSQAFRWFREKYDLGEQYGVFPHHTIIINHLIDGGVEEEAELACLKKLIEIVKKK